MSNGRSSLDPLPGELSPVRLMVKVEALDEALNALEAEGIRTTGAYQLLLRNRNKMAESAAEASGHGDEHAIRIPPDERSALLTSINNSRQKASIRKQDVLMDVRDRVRDGEDVLYRFSVLKPQVDALHEAATAWNNTEETRTPVTASRAEALMRREEL